MSSTPSTADLNVQPRQRREVYERLADLPAGRSVRDLLGDLGMPESELRETLRKLHQAGLVRRTRAVWCAVPLGTDEPSGRAVGNGAGAPAED